ncbi:hypothetical protein OEZ60_12225 [Defluviimonas sp. WL0024]|uniref:Uncharacterized protein n=2 Tax=Albidovulum TaxID=205889 RepID=A0ABT3J393_9RHOB|nr:MULTISPECIES: hypothetical protein [Defluviimonas]MCU9848771.1 hypothetical protein [Defluviimonas sp. WL0024]MCW3782165.1 hypothetical protein [Defluviimonas salinarum]
MAQTLKYELPTYEEQRNIMARARQMQGDAMAEAFRALARALRRMVKPRTAATSH